MLEALIVGQTVARVGGRNCRNWVTTYLDGYSITECYIPQSHHVMANNLFIVIGIVAFLIAFMYFSQTPDEEHPLTIRP